MALESGVSTEVAAGKVVLADPFRCCMWSLHDRIEEGISESNCQIEIESFATHGQLVAVLGRRLCGDSRHDFELIYGSRRLFIARHLNQPLRVRLCTLSDRRALIAMDIENRQRMDVSPYERGMSYARWLRSGLFSTQEEIAKELQVSPSQVSLCSAIIDAAADRSVMRLIRKRCGMIGGC